MFCMYAWQVDGRNALELVRETYRNLRSFLDEWPDAFVVRGADLYLRRPSEGQSARANGREFAPVGGALEEVGEMLEDEDGEVYRVYDADDVELFMEASDGHEAAAAEAPSEGSAGVADRGGSGDRARAGGEGVGGDAESDGVGGDVGLSAVIHPSVVPDLKIMQLRQLLKEYGCPVSGNKAELVDRLLAAMASAQ